MGKVIVESTVYHGEQSNEGRYVAIRFKFGLTERVFSFKYFYDIGSMTIHHSLFVKNDPDFAHAVKVKDFDAFFSLHANKTTKAMKEFASRLMNYKNEQGYHDMTFAEREDLDNYFGHYDIYRRISACAECKNVIDDEDDEYLQDTIESANNESPMVLNGIDLDGEDEEKSEMEELDELINGKKKSFKELIDESKERKKKKAVKKGKTLPKESRLVIYTGRDKPADKLVKNNCYVMICRYEKSSLLMNNDGESVMVSNNCIQFDLGGESKPKTVKKAPSRGMEGIHAQLGGMVLDYETDSSTTEKSTTCLTDDELEEVFDMDEDTAPIDVDGHLENLIAQEKDMKSYTTAQKAVFLAKKFLGDASEEAIEKQAKEFMRMGSVRVEQSFDNYFGVKTRKKGYIKSVREDVEEDDGIPKEFIGKNATIVNTDDDEYGTYGVDF